jgi:hypothetical protein
LITTGVVVGGVYYYYRDTIRQAIELYRLVQTVRQDEEEPSQIAIDEVKGELEESYSQTVITGDETALKQVSTIRSHVYDLYVEEMQQIQNQVKFSHEKEILFAKLHLLTFSRLVTCLISFHILLLLARIKVCLIGRSNRLSHPESNDERRQDHRELLSGLRILSSKDTVARIDRISRQVFQDGRWCSSISPVTVVKFNQILEILDQLVTDILAELAHSDDSAWSWLLGKLATCKSSIVSETLDVLESPQFSAVLTFIVKEGVSMAVERSVPSGNTWPLAAALLMPGIRVEPDMVFAKSGPYYEKFKSTKIVDEFCYSVYAAVNEAEDDIMHALHTSSDEAQIEKLGKLLEQLVRADIDK